MRDKNNTGDVILDLHGNKFRVIGIRDFLKEIPKSIEGEFIFTRDLVHDIPFTLISYPNNRFEAFIYSDHFYKGVDLYLWANLEKIDYIEKTILENLTSMSGSPKRIPRPMGFTSLMSSFHKTKDKGYLKKAQDYFINQWLLNNGYVCGISYDINHLADTLNVEPSYIQVLMRDRLLSNKIWDKDKQEEMFNSLCGEQLLWALEDRMEISKQVEILKKAQNGKYVPYLTAELNKALKLKLDSSGSLQTILKNLIGGGTTNIFNQINSNNVIETNNQYITIEEARNMIQDEVAHNYIESSEVKFLESKYDIGDLPEVVATKQGNIEQKEVSSLDNVELNAIVDNYKGALEKSSELHHQLRREIEQNIDPDDYDPELDIYDEPDTSEEDSSLESIGSMYLNK